MQFIPYIAALVILAFWFGQKNDESRTHFLPFLLLGSVGAHAAIVMMADAAMKIRVLALTTDLLVLAGAGLVFMIINSKKSLTALGVFLALAGGAWYASEYQLVRFQPVLNDGLADNAELLIEIKPGYDIADLSSILKEYDLNAERAFTPKDADQTDLDDYFVIDVPNDQLSQLNEIEEILRKTDEVEWLEENEEIQLKPIDSEVIEAVTLNEKFNDPHVKELWGFEKMNVPQLYDLIAAKKVKPNKTALIAILDTGVDANQEDIKGNFKTLEKSSNTDKQGHGTHCAGIAASVSNNNIGIASFAPDNTYVKVASIKVLSDSGMGTQQRIINGMIKAVDGGADVLSLSLGGRSTQSSQKAYNEAVKYAKRKNVIVVVAAGNSNRNAKDYAPVNAKGVIGVSAIDQFNNRAAFSNYVTDIPMGIAAPGVGIYSCMPNNKYAPLSGTSMATPYVAGLVGLMKSIQPSLTATQAWQILNDTGTETSNTNQTGRMINAERAVEALLQ